uniref:Nad4L n=1 Tax=Neorotalia gaimardi TaxID=2855197 RepID=UPI0023F26351|nr:Nad4L [Neorotalia gaimardi]WEF49964.1 Nad4L [Neorotalia gaimardi]
MSSIVRHLVIPYPLLTIQLSLILILGSVFGMIIYRNLLLKFFLCFESFIFIISVIIITWSCSIFGYIVVLYLLWNPTFEVILGLTILFAYSLLINS